MSFQSSYRRAIDPTRPREVRFVALRSCIARYCELTGESWHETYVRLGQALGFGQYPSEDQITAAAHLLHDMRQQVQRARGIVP